MTTTPDPSAAFGFGTPWADQIDFLKRKLNLPTERWDDIMRAAHDRAFVVAGAQKADLLSDLHAAVIKSAEGGSLAGFRKDFDQIVAKHGWTGWTGEGSAEGEAWRTKIIYTTNMSASYAAGRYKYLTDPESLQAMPYWRYIHADGILNPRQQHVDWHGLTLPHDHPFWVSHFPPNGFNCHCRITAVSRAEGLRSKAAGLGEPPAGWDKIDTGTLEPNGIGKGWGYAPGANVTRPLQEFVDNKLINLSGPIGAAMWDVLKPVLAMERQLKWWEALDAWQASPQSGRSEVVGALDRATLGWLKAEKDTEPATAAIGIREGLIRGTKQARHTKDQDGLLDEDWRRLTAIIESPEAIYFDTRTDNLVYVVSAGDAAGIKLTVKFDARVNKTERMNMVISGFRQSDATIAELVRGKLYVALP